jgi:uncharacterized membrane-anchored protein YitT (DUF2179 family)
MSDAPKKGHGTFDDLQALVTGTVIVAVGLGLIKQAGLLTGGTVGLAFLIHYASGSNFGATLFLINLPFYLLAYRRVGRDFTLKTMLTVLMVSLFTEALPSVLVISRIDPFFAATAGGLMIGVGLLILFRHRASLGGFNVLVLYLQERYGWRAGLTQLALDCSVLAAATLIASPQVLLASVLGAVLLNLALAVNHKPGRYIAF